MRGGGGWDGRAACVPAPVPALQVPAGGACRAGLGGGMGCGGRWGLLLPYTCQAVAVVG